MNVIETLESPQLLGGLPAFRDLSTWRPWLVLVRAVFGLPMDEADLALFRRHTGRTTPRPGGYPEAIAIVGVQSGKTRMAAALAAHAALTGEPGTHALLIAQDQRSALRTLLRYAREPFDTIDAFKAEVERSTADTLDLRNGVSLSAYPCRPEGVRGIRACIVVVDEAAFFVSTDGRPTDREMLRVARGRLATTGGKLVVLSSPYGQSGALWDLHRTHYGKDDSSTLVWQASAPEMNPTLPADYIERMRQDDPDAYRSEVLGEFRAGLSNLLEPDALDAVVARGVREHAPDSAALGRFLKGVYLDPGRNAPRYASFVDAASGTGKDSFTVAVAHHDGQRAILDCLRAWAPPFNPSAAIAEASALLKSYGLRLTTGDRYAAGFVVEGFRACGITYRASERDRSAIYLDFLPLVNAGSVLLLDLPDLLRELRGLERRRGTSGRDRVDHRPGAHDDLANAAAGALTLAVPAMRSVARVVDCNWG